MKKVGFAAAAMLAVFTVACGGRDEANNENREATVGTGGEVTNNTATPADTRTSTVNDVQEWTQDVAVGNMAEIELGKLASERAMNAEVKRYGQMMVKDHTAAGNELKQVVGNQIQLSTELDEQHRELADKLRGMKGMEFDREYMNAMVDGHEEMKGLLEERARRAVNNTGTTQRNPGTTTNNPNATPGNTTTTGNTAANTGSTGNTAQLDAALTQWAAKTLPAVERHLQQAQQLRDKVENTGRNTTQNNNTGNTRPNTRPGQ
jgi:putative membrane protein